MKKPEKHLFENGINYFHYYITPEVDAYIAHLEQARDEAIKAMQDILDSPRWIDEATVPKAGIAAAPQQVVFNASILFPRIQKLREFISKYASEKVEGGENEKSP